MRWRIWGIGAGMALANCGFAEPVDRHVVETDMTRSGVAADWLRWSGRSNPDAPARLRPAATLGKARTTERGQAAAPADEDSSNSSGDTPELRLESNLRTRLPLAGPAFVPPVLPGQILNQDGLVPASRMQVRDGEIFLEGDAGVQQDASSSGRAPALVMPSVGSVQVKRED